MLKPHPLLMSPCLYTIIYSVEHGSNYRSSKEGEIMLEIQTFQMREVCEEVGLSYETLKFYCNEGLVPNHERDSNNYRIFDEKDVGWIKGLVKLRECGMSISDMKKYMELCFDGIASVPERKQMLENTRKKLEEERTRIEKSLAFIDEKQAYYDGVSTGEFVYSSNLIKN